MVYFVLTSRCIAYRHAATTFYQPQRGFGDRRQHAQIQEFCQLYLVLSLFYSLQRGSNGFIAEKTIYTYTLPKIQRGSIIFQGGGVSNFFQGRVQMLISLETHIRTCYFPGGGGMSGPLSPLDPHMGNVIITGQYLPQSRF